MNADKHGLWLEEADDREGYAVFSGCEGEDPKLVAFFVHEEDAEAFLTLKDLDDVTFPRTFDPAIEIAVLAEEGIVAANDFEIRKFSELLERLKTARALADEDK